MYKQDGQLYYSPSDLTRYMESPFVSWMDRFALESPEQAPQKDPEDALKNALAIKGYAHEDALESAFIAQGRSVIKIDGASAAEKYTNTLESMRKGVDVIVQGRLELGQFGGYADFLIKVEHEQGDKPSVFGEWHYEVWDTKLANTLKPIYVVQLCCYAEMLESIQRRLPEFITVSLGNGENARLKTNDFYYYYKTLKSSFIVDQSNFSCGAVPDPADSRYSGDTIRVSNY